MSYYFHFPYTTLWDTQTPSHCKNPGEIKMRCDLYTFWNGGNNFLKKHFRPLSSVCLGRYSNVQNRICPQVINPEQRFSSQDFTGKREGGQHTPSNSSEGCGVDRRAARSPRVPVWYSKWLQVTPNLI